MMVGSITARTLDYFGWLVVASVGALLSPYPKTVILKKMSWGNVVEWCVNRVKL